MGPKGEKCQKQQQRTRKLPWRPVSESDKAARGSKGLEAWLCYLQVYHINFRSASFFAAAAAAAVDWRWRRGCRSCRRVEHVAGVPVGMLLLLLQQFDKHKQTVSDVAVAATATAAAAVAAFVVNVTKWRHMLPCWKLCKVIRQTFARGRGQLQAATLEYTDIHTRIHAQLIIASINTFVGFNSWTDRQTDIMPDGRTFMCHKVNSSQAESF